MSSAMPRSLMSRAFACLALSALSISAQTPAPRRPLDGTVVDSHGTPVAGALVVASGVAFNGWASTSPEGSFHLNAVGTFVSVRHAGLKARLIKTSDLAEPVRIVMERAEAGAQTMPACNLSSGKGGRWIGGGLKVNVGRAKFKGPVNGEHDSHWYVKHDKNTLHIVDGYAWHACLPSEQQLVDSQNISVRSWEHGDIVGLDLSGLTKDGKHWRWLSAPIAAAIEYTEATQESSDYFDTLINSSCFGI